MKKVLPYIFPAIALVIVLFLGYRWYTGQTKPGQINNTGEGIEIEDLSSTDQSSMLRGAGDYKTVQLQGEGEVAGSIRYEVKDGKVRFSVMAFLPELTEGSYEVWLKRDADTNPSKAFTLEAGKGGYIGSASIDESNLPFEVIITKELRPDLTMEQVVLRGKLEKVTN
jgi:hypothetical protein